jgi:hypothetical protein
VAGESFDETHVLGGAGDDFVSFAEAFTVTWLIKPKARAKEMAGNIILANEKKEK